MAMTLEAAIVLPISLALITGLTGAAQPVYHQVRRTASLSAQAVWHQINPEHLYQVESLDNGAVSLPALQTSPQRLIEWLQLIRENSDLLNQVGNVVKPS